MPSDESDDDVPQLSASTFAALHEFYQEQEQREKRLADTITESDSYNDIDEDWQLSQFWYDDKTTDTIVDIALKIVGPKGKIALISCPTLYKKLRKKAEEESEVTLFEYDKRFSIYGSNYIFYDYKSPLQVPRDKSSYYDLVIADPPFLSEECLTKTSVTIKFLAKDKIMLCTGAIMEDLVQRLLDLKKTSFQPKHKNNLANDFGCFTNFNIDNL